MGGWGGGRERERESAHTCRHICMHALVYLCFLSEFNLSIFLALTVQQRSVLPVPGLCFVSTYHTDCER